MKKESQKVLDFLKNVFNDYEKTENKLNASNQQLTANEQQLRASNQQLIASEHEIKKHAHDLEERVKELGCFYGISETVRKRETVEEILQDITKIIPPAWQYPKITCAKISFGNIEYKTDNYEDSKWKLSSDIIVKRKLAGKIEVCYLEQKSHNDVDPFLKEERILLDNITERLGRIVERKNGEEELKVSNQQLAANEQQLRASNQQLAANEQQLRAANQQLTSKTLDLKESENKFHSLISEMSEGVVLHEVIYDKKGKAIDYRIIETNKAFDKILNIKSEDAMGKLSTELYGTVEAPFLDIYAKVAETGNHYEFEQYFPPMKKYFHISVYCPNKGKFATVFSDITEHKQAEEALYKSKQQFESMILNSPDMIMSQNADGQIIFVSPQCENILGYTAEEIKNMDTSKHIHPDDVKIATETSLKTLEGDELINFEYRFFHKSGDIVWLNHSAKPIIANGKITEVQSTIRNITLRKLTEYQIKKDLKIQTALIQEIYHRTKNNMAVISAMLSMQSRHSDNEFVKSTFKEIKNKIQAMSLVHQKLYKAKDLSNINLKDYIEDLANLIMQSYGVLSEKITMKFDLQDVKISIDSAVPLGLIINELVSNIFKHAFPNRQEGEIFIRLFKEEDETINLELIDNGIGFPQNFDPRKDGSMGFASVFSIVENQLKGEISVKSENGLKWHIKIKDDKKKERI